MNIDLNSVGEGVLDRWGFYRLVQFIELLFQAIKPLIQFLISTHCFIEISLGSSMALS